MRPLILVPTINSRHWNACYLQLLSAQRCQHPPQAERCCWGGVGHGLRCAGGVPSSVRPLHSTMPLYLFNEAAPPCPPEEAVHKLTQLSHEDPNLAMFPS